jgi:hypothetical protein
MTLREGLREAAWAAWASVGYPVVFLVVMAAMINTQAGNAFMNAVDRIGSSVASYALTGVPMMVVLFLLGLLASRLQAPVGYRFLGLVWVVVFFVVTAIVMGFFMPGEVTLAQGLVSAAKQSETWLVGGLGWWAGMRMLSPWEAEGTADAVPRLGRLGWISISSVGLVGVLGLVGYLMSSFR